MTDEPNKRWRLLQGLLVVALPLNLAVGALRHLPQQRAEERQVRKINHVIDYVRTVYVEDDPEVIGYQNLVQNALNGMLQRLDGHSRYLPPADTKTLDEINRGEYTGIGVSIGKGERDILVRQVQPDGPADHAGLRDSDRIVSIAGRDTSEMDMEEAVKLIKGERGTDVTVRVYRPTDKSEYELTIQRARVKYPTVRRAHMVSPGIAYVHVLQFNEKTCDDLIAHLRQLRPQMRGLILDLRENGGGLFGAAVTVSSLFLPPGLTVVSTVPRRPENRDVFPATARPPKLLRLPLVILVNHRSASAAEIVAGCMRDHARATLIGVRTYGKGSVQHVLPLPEDNSSIHLTTRYYYTPNDECIHGRGIEPHIKVEVPHAERKQLQQQLWRFTTDRRENDVDDPQLERAVEHLRQALDRETP